MWTATVMHFHVNQMKLHQRQRNYRTREFVSFFSFSSAVFIKQSILSKTRSTHSCNDMDTTLERDMVHHTKCNISTSQQVEQTQKLNAIKRLCAATAELKWTATFLLTSSSSSSSSHAIKFRIYQRKKKTNRTTYLCRIHSKIHLIVARRSLVHQPNSILVQKFHLQMKRMTPMVHRTLKFNLSSELVNNRTGLLHATKFAIYLIDLRTFFDFITAKNYFHSNCASRENEKWRNENGKIDGKHTHTWTNTISFENVAELAVCFTRVQTLFSTKY